MVAWTRADRLALVSIVVGVLASFASFVVPEVRQGLGLADNNEHSKRRGVTAELPTNTDTERVGGRSSETKGATAARDTATTLSVSDAAELPDTSVATSLPSVGDDDALRKRVVDAATPSELREATEELARRFAANATGTYTVFFGIFCDQSNVQKAVSVSKEVWFVPQTIGSRKCYRFFWGRYGARSDAELAIARVPATIRDPYTRVVPVPRS